MERLLPLVALGFVLGLSACGEPGVGVDADLPDGALPDMPISLDSGPADGSTTDQSMSDAGPLEQGACACLAVSTCCDGCQPVNALGWCHAGGDQYGRCSTAGTCNTGAIGAPVTCAADACHAVDESALPSCVVEPANAGASCDDGSATTFGDVCDDAGGCVGTTCVSDLPCVARAWNGTACVSSVQAGASCDDGNVSTHTDECQVGGSCEGTPCECTSGPCCDGCFFRGAGVVCDVRVVEDICNASVGASCGMQGHQQRVADVSCSGLRAGCDGASVTRPGATAVSCGPGTGCFDLNPAPLSAVCFTCP